MSRTRADAPRRAGPPSDHNPPPVRLYIPLGGAPTAGDDANQQAATLVDAAARQHGLAAEIYQIRPKDLRNQRVLAALRGRGIGRLPALLAGGGVHVGLREIQVYYSRATPRAPRSAPRGPEQSGRAPADTDPYEPADDGAEAMLDAFYAQEMRVGRNGGEVADDLGLDSEAF
jgi:hypothetical protein